MKAAAFKLQVTLKHLGGSGALLPRAVKNPLTMLNFTNNLLLIEALPITQSINIVCV